MTCSHIHWNSFSCMCLKWGSRLLLIASYCWDFRHIVGHSHWSPHLQDFSDWQAWWSQQHHDISSRQNVWVLSRMQKQLDANVFVVIAVSASLTNVLFAAYQKETVIDITNAEMTTLWERNLDESPLYPQPPFPWPDCSFAEWKDEWSGWKDVSALLSVPETIW